MILTKDELYSINGGGYTWLIVAGAIITFLSGLIDGFVKPLGCK